MTHWSPVKSSVIEQTLKRISAGSKCVIDIWEWLLSCDSLLKQFHCILFYIWTQCTMLLINYKSLCNWGSIYLNYHSLPLLWICLWWFLGDAFSEFLPNVAELKEMALRNYAAREKGMGSKAIVISPPKDSVLSSSFFSEL